MKVAMLYICTGRYTIFWKNFFEATEKYFLPNHDKYYFVFTDGEIEYDNHPRVKRIQQQNLGWPDNTHKRFAMFANISKDLVLYDYTFFCNANLIFMDVIDDEILPSPEQGIVVVQHPGFYNKNAHEFTFERNPNSKAFIAHGEGKYYVCGGFNGGITAKYLDMVNTLKQQIDIDEQNGITAIWHDESHLNKYIIDHPYKLLTPAFCYPEEEDLPYTELVRIKHKGKYGGHAYMRGESDVASPQETEKSQTSSNFLSAMYNYVLKCSKKLYHKLTT